MIWTKLINYEEEEEKKEIYRESVGKWAPK